MQTCDDGSKTWLGKFAKMKFLAEAFKCRNPMRNCEFPCLNDLLKALDPPNINLWLKPLETS